MINQFTALGRDPRVSFLGNVAVARDIQLPDLRSFYNAVRLASSTYCLTERDYRASVLFVLISQIFHGCRSKHSASACMQILDIEQARWNACMPHCLYDMPNQALQAPLRMLIDMLKSHACCLVRNLIAFMLYPSYFTDAQSFACMLHC